MSVFLPIRKASTFRVCLWLGRPAENGVKHPGGRSGYGTSRAMRKPMQRATAIEGFTLVEMLIALTVLTFGLLAVGQLLCASFSCASLARSKSTAAIAAQDQLESLADLYRQRPMAAELSVGNHGPLQAQVVNPLNRIVLNRYNVSWVVSPVPDPRPGKMLSSRLVRVTAIPATAEGNTNTRVTLNKIVSISGILSPRMD